jgi:SNF2 family DNA or RNA helicase
MTVNRKDDAFVLWPAQQDAVAWMRGRDSAGGGILAHDVGMGKTVTVCTFIGEDPVWPVLVAVPKSAITDWVAVLLRTRTITQQLCVVDGPSRLDGCRGSKLVLVTHSCLQGATTHEALQGRSWGRVVVDEAHVLKNPGTRIHKAVRRLTAHSKWALTATPIHNSPRDLLSIARVVGVDTTDVQLVRDQLMLLATKAPSELEPIEVRDMIVPLAHEGEASLYASVRERFMESRSLGDSTADLSSKRALEALLRCMQACTHPALYYQSMAQKPGLDGAEQLAMGRKAAESRALQSSKFDVLLADLEEHLGDEKSLVFCNFTDEMQLLSDMLRGRGITHRCLNGGMSTEERHEAVSEFRAAGADGPRVFLLQIQCAGVALNLQAASRVYLLRPQWNPAVEKQAFGRAHRSGQTRRVVAVRLVAEGTVDELVLQRSSSKVKEITAALNDGSLEACLTGRVVRAREEAAEGAECAEAAAEGAECAEAAAEGAECAEGAEGAECAEAAESI